MSGQSERTQIASLQSSIPTEFWTRISRNNEYKSRLIELLQTYIKEQKDECLNLLNSDRIVFSTEDTCFLLTFAGNSNITESETSHEEADIKVLLHAMHLREAHNVMLLFFPFW